LQAYAIKSTREAMVHTRWTLPNTAHEEALKKFVASILKPGKGNPFLRDFVPFQQSIAYSGMVNGLTQTLVKIISPGTPDFYQGSELWDLRLVDPDNRQPVDFTKYTSMLEALKQRPNRSASFAVELARNWQDGRIKLYAIWKALNFRRGRAEFFSKSDFLELKATGPHAEHIHAILRQHKREWALLVAPRWLARAHDTNADGNPGALWTGTKIEVPSSAPESWENIFTAEKISSAVNQQKSIGVSETLLSFPVALLTGVKS
jgi:(1->4)-alpha-D-glucan 1-alpha-D-glucosylmutase